MVLRKELERSRSFSVNHPALYRTAPEDAFLSRRSGLTSFGVSSFSRGWRASPLRGNMEQPVIYFDNAATGWPKPENVYKFMDHFYRTLGVNPGRSGYDLAIEAGSLLANLRKRLTRFFGG